MSILDNPWTAQKTISKLHVHGIKVTNSIQLYIGNKMIIRSYL